jgi:hypothetical protein
LAYVVFSAERTCGVAGSALLGLFLMLLFLGIELPFRLFLILAQHAFSTKHVSPKSSFLMDRDAMMPSPKNTWGFATILTIPAEIQF